MVIISLEESDGAAVGESSRRKPKRKRKFPDNDENDRFLCEEREDEADDGIDEDENKEATRTVDGSISVILTDPEVLDCTVCYESLKIPVFQCENGHIACSSCCAKLKNKCPSCSFSIGYNRCRAMEKVIESVKVLCQNSGYGCNERLSLSGRKDHEDKCIHSPCTCPIYACGFLGSCQQLSRHCSEKHSASVKRFRYNRRLPVLLDKGCKIIILEEEKAGDLLILNNSPETNGNMITVKYVGPILPKRVLSYDLMARQDVNTLTLQSAMEIHSALGKASSCFLLVPPAFLNSNSILKMELCIRLSNLK